MEVLRILTTLYKFVVVNKNILIKNESIEELSYTNKQTYNDEDKISYAIGSDAAG